MRNIVGGRAADRDDYIGTVFGCAALVAVSDMVMCEAFDLIEANTDYAENKRVYHAMRSAEILMGDTMRSITGELVHKEDAAWMADFGNAVYERISVDVSRLRFAIANVLGKAKGLQSPSSVALLLVSQSLASEAADYAVRRADFLRGCYVENRYGTMVSVRNKVLGFSCRSADMQLRTIAKLILSPVLTFDIDLTSEPQVMLGCKIILGKLGNTETWIYARDKADRLNNVKHTEE